MVCFIRARQSLRHGCNQTICVPFYLLIVRAASQPWGNGELYEEKRQALSRSSCSPARQHLLNHHLHLACHPSPHTSCSTRGRKKKTPNKITFLMQLMRPLLRQNLPLWFPGSGRRTGTICASFTITCTLCSKQITPNDSGPYERRKEAHGQN